MSFSGELPFAPGQKPDGPVDDHNQKRALAVVVTFPTLGAVAVALRLWGRKLSRYPFGWDDYMIVLAEVFAIGQSVTSWFFVRTNYVGLHSYDVPSPWRWDWRSALIWNYANMLLYNPTLALVKASVLVFLWRLNHPSKHIAMMIWFTFAFNLALSIASQLVLAFQCSPVQFVYDWTISGGHCVDIWLFSVITGAFYILTDLLIISIPVFMMHKLQMPLRDKVAVILTLSLGGVVTFISIWRLVVFIGSVKGTGVDWNDPTYSIDFVCSNLECDLALIVACIPSMKVLVRRCCPSFLGSFRYGSDSSSPTVRIYRSDSAMPLRTFHLPLPPSDGSSIEARLNRSYTPQ